MRGEGTDWDQALTPQHSHQPWGDATVEGGGAQPPTRPAESLAAAAGPGTAGPGAALALGCIPAWVTGRPQSGLVPGSLKFQLKARDNVHRGSSPGAREATSCLSLLPMLQPRRAQAQADLVTFPRPPLPTSTAQDEPTGSSGHSPGDTERKLAWCVCPAGQLRLLTQVHAVNVGS